MLSLPLLSITIFLPLIGAFIILLNRIGGGISERKEENAKWVALWSSLVTLGLVFIVWYNFNPNSSEFQWVDKSIWFSELNIGYRVGIDGISLPFLILTAVLIPVCILSSWEAIKTRVSEFMIAFLIMETLLLGVFAALDFILFYVFFEGVLIPMFFIIGIWGGERRVYAAIKFFLYTLTGSVFMLLAIAYLYFDVGNTDISVILTTPIHPSVQNWLWFAFFAAFAVKIPMWPLHTWLPDAHVESPTAGSAILAGVLLKMGGYGFLRISLPILPEASANFAPFVFLLSTIAIVYTSFVAFAQQDMKKLIAYSSIAHMGFVTMGIFTADAQGLQGAVMQMFSHGLVSAALFLSVGCLYERAHTREISYFGGVAERMPIFAIVFMLLTLAAIGLPGTSNFLAEFLVLIGTYQVNRWFAIVASFGLLLSAIYMLWLYWRIFLGPPVEAITKSFRDLSLREKIILFPLIGIVLGLGIYPRPVFSTLDVTVEDLIDQYNNAIENKDVLEKKSTIVSQAKAKERLI